MICRVFSTVALLLAQPVLAGSYFGVDGTIDCENGPCNHLVIAHPTGYTSAGMGGEIVVPICIRSGDDQFLRAALEETIDIWNGLTATTGNCLDCGSADDPPGQDAGSVSIMVTTVLHELGHCAMGLAHTNSEGNNFTTVREATSQDAGADLVRGSRDDIVTPDPQPPIPSALPQHWFRRADNDPVVIDGTVIDLATYSILAIDLPPGSTWIANANRSVSALLGASDTQNVMHAISARNMVYRGLTADDVNTVRHGMTGLDRVAGTADDYSIRLELVDDCGAARIEAQWDDLGPPGAGGQVLGQCIAELDYIGPEPPGPAGRIHYSMNDDILFDRLLLEINSEAKWGVFADGRSFRL